MLTPTEIKSIDRSSICDVYDEWPEYCRVAYDRDMKVDENLFRDIDKIVFSGMGGSATTGDIIHDWLLDRINVPILVSKGYHVPGFVNEKTLFISMSVSGNTEETLTAMLEAHSAGAKVAGISQGGELEAICNKKKIPHSKIQQRILPRITLPEMLYTALKLLALSPLMNNMKTEIEGSIRTMEGVGREINVNIPLEHNPAKQLAQWMLHSIPALYCSPLQRGVGVRFKNSVNENAKINAISSELLDSCHNELVSWGHKEKSQENRILRPMLLRSSTDTEEVRTRFDVFKKVLEGNGHKVREVPFTGSTALSNIVSALYLLDYSSIYLGILRKVDPTPITAVFEFKDEMKKRLDYFGKFVKPKL